MTGSALIFTIVGVSFVSCRLMDIINWLDSPRSAGERRRRRIA